MRSVIFILMWLMSGIAFACSCREELPDINDAVAQALEVADSVVLAKAIHIDTYLQDHDDHSFEGERTTFETIRLWKGNVGTTFETEIITACCMCGMSFVVGETYLLYLYRKTSSGALATSICTRTKPYAKAAPEIEILERITPNQSFQPTSPSSLRSSCAAAELHR
jgi:hypothetical protein